MNEVSDKTYQQLRRDLDRIERTLSIVGVGLWELNYSKRSFKTDRRNFELHGIDPDVIRDKQQAFRAFVEKIHPDDKQALFHQLIEKQEIGHDFNLTYRVICPDGSIRHFRSLGRIESRRDSQNDAVAPVRTELTASTEMTYFGATWDATPEILAEQELREQKAKMLASTKMAALGEMSGGIAHEINNPLTVIQARSFQLNQMAEANELVAAKVKQVAESISKTADKIAKIVRSLRSFSRDAAKDPFHLIPVQQVLNETLEFCRNRLHNHGVDIRVDPVPEDLELECRIVQIQQVLLNLLNNSFDAIEHLEDKWIRMWVEETNDQVKIHVRDSGPGIPADIAAKMMMPFYTTKEVGKGTGLGLSISRDIMKAHQGNLTYDAADTCTHFIISLPKSQRP